MNEHDILSLTGDHTALCTYGVDKGITKTFRVTNDGRIEVDHDGCSTICPVDTFLFMHTVNA